ncbi:hypothetical protein HNQ02_003341 [Flavobacterium sp. 7E]|uniref:hypothetical protein n=1 Tax=Flavobacterium sp. 7E TaxID=2735898 RepID=UPI00156F8791|nr:hypothetical protein [Flavobacterium sp. 7E]NRS90401.1 hypothetical protein [Flavobacterium sp. 7E]
MNAKENKEIDNLVNKMMKKATLESPSFDFTAQIMEQITSLQQSKATIYEPLISRKAWFFICTGLVALMGYVLLGTQQQPTSWDHFLDLNIFINDTFSIALHRFLFSNVMLYSLAFLSVMVLVQVFFLSMFFNKRFEN